MNVVSFFSGAGGLDLGFALAGHNILWANDFDEEAVNSYNENIGKYLNHKAILQDVVELLDTTEENINILLPDCDLIIGGFPCQGFTIANLERSMEDSRNFLYLQLLKAISVKQPPFFLLENVKGLENIEGGKILPMIMDDLQEAGTSKSKFFPKDSNPGYTVSYNVLNALYFGVPENRERVIILGIRNDILDSTPIRKFVDFERKEKKYDFRKRLIIPYTHSREGKPDDKKPYEIVNKLYEDFISGQIVPSKVQVSELLKTKTVRDAIEDLPLDFDETILNHIGSKCKVKINNTIGNRATNWDKEAPTIMGRGSGTGGPLIPPHPNLHRRLTVREVGRIQTFPDKFFFCGSNSCGYRQIGNAVPVLMAFNIAKIFNE